MTVATSITSQVHLDAVAELLAVAFDEPVTRWLIPDPDRRQQTMTGLFTIMAEDALTNTGRIDVIPDTDGQPLAAAIWFDYTTIDGLPLSDPRFSQVFGPYFHRWHALDDLITRQHLTSPHHYLFAVGVHPGHQSQGLGGQLLTHGHQHLHGLPAYLEATSCDSRRLYQRHGYHDLGTLQLPDGPTLWQMALPGTDD
jgi:GNAT superfamily N-acetyltransferase